MTAVGFDIIKKSVNIQYTYKYINTNINVIIKCLLQLSSNGVWEDLKPGSNFTQLDVTHKRIRYVHSGAVPAGRTDSFTFRVRPPGERPHPPEVFNVHIGPAREGTDISLETNNIQIKVIVNIMVRLIIIIKVVLY